MPPSPRPSRIRVTRSICSSSVMALMKPVISRTTGSSPLSSSTSIMLSSAPFEPESGSDAPSLTSNSRIFSIRNATFSTETASSGIAALPGLACRVNAQACEMIHCAGTRKPASFTPTKPGHGEAPDDLEGGQGQNHENRRTGDDRQYPLHSAARQQRGNPQITLAHSAFRYRGRPAQNVDPLAGGGDPD